MSELFKKFKVGKPIEEEPHYELYIEGDCNDADYIDRTTKISIDDMENDEFLMYFISFMASCRSKDFIKKDKDWKRYFDDTEFYWEYLPKETRGFDVDIHTVSKVKLTYVSFEFRYPVSIPLWNKLFNGDDDKRTKLDAALFEYKRKEKERLDRLDAEEGEKLETEHEL